MSLPVAPPFDPADAWHMPYAPTSYDLWTRTNVGEVFPEAVTPLTFSVMAALGEAIFLSNPEQYGLIPNDLIRDGVPPAVFRAINGRLFYNTGLVHHIFTDRFGFPSWFWMLSLGGPQDAAGAYFTKQPLRSLRLLRGLPSVLTESRRQRRVIAAFRRDARRMRAEAASLRREDLTRLAATALVERLSRVMKAAEAPEQQLFDGSAAALNAYGILAGLCERWCGDRALANDLVTGLATLSTAEATVALWRAARAAARSPEAAHIIRTAPAAEVCARLHAEPAADAVAAALDRFFDDFGHRCVDEFELAVPRWSEDPSFVVATLRTYLSAPPDADPEALLARQRVRRGQAEREAKRRMQTGLLHRLLPYRWLVFRGVLRQARDLLPLRENPKHHFLMYSAELRRTILELAGRLAERGLIAAPEEVFFLTRPELAAAAEAAERGAPGPGLPLLVEARRALYRRYQAWDPPEAIPGTEVERVERELLAEREQGTLRLHSGQAGNREQLSMAPGEDHVRVPAGLLRGIAASGGVVTARARVAISPDEGAGLEPGEVLVAPFTDPGWTPLFTVAGAVVMDLGGLLSHGAIVAREYGIPAVVNTRTGTATIRTGQLITVDGSAGTVTWEE